MTTYLNVLNHYPHFKTKRENKCKKIPQIRLVEEYWLKIQSRSSIERLSKTNCFTCIKKVLEAFILASCLNEDYTNSLISSMVLSYTKYSVKKFIRDKLVYFPSDHETDARTFKNV